MNAPLIDALAEARERTLALVAPLADVSATGIFASAARSSLA
jgi:hypothetical protein